MKVLTQVYTDGVGPPALISPVAAEMLHAVECRDIVPYQDRLFQPVGASSMTHADSLLVAAAGIGDASLCQRLLDAGARVDAGGGAAMISAAAGGHLPVLRVLERAGADFGGPSGGTAWAVARHAGDQSLMPFFQERCDLASDDALDAEFRELPKVEPKKLGRDTSASLLDALHLADPLSAFKSASLIFDRVIDRAAAMITRAHVESVPPAAFVAEPTEAALFDTPAAVLPPLEPPALPPAAAVSL